MAGGIEVPIDGDLSPLLATFGELPGRTKAEMDAVGRIIQDEATKGQIYKGFLAIEGVSEKSAKRATAALLKQMDAAVRETEHATAAIAKATTEATKDVKKGASAIFGGVIGDVEDVVGALGALGPVGIAASAAMAAVAGAAAAVWAEYKVVSMLYEFADATGKLDEEQAGLAAAIDETKKAIGERFVPVFEGMLIGVTAGTLAIRDFSLRALDAGSAMLAWYQTLPTFAKALVGNIVPALQQADAIDKLSTGLRSGAIDAGGYVAEARNLIGTLAETKAATEAVDKSTKNHTAAHKAATKVIADHADAAGKAALAEIQYDQDLTEQILQNDEAIQQSQEKAAEKIAEIKEKQRQEDLKDFHRQYDQAEALQTARLGFTKDMLFAGVEAAGTLAQAVSDGAEEGSEAQKKAALIAFRLNQAASIGTIAMNTAEAITKAIALFGPPPSPAGIAGISFAAAIGLVQAGVVAAQSPPTFHTGGVLASTPLSPDETTVVARKGEEIRTRQEQQTSNTQPLIVQMVYQHRVFDSFVSDNMRQAGSPLRREIHKASGRRVGHRG